MPEDNRFKYSNFTEVFGELQNIHRVRRSFSEKFLPPAVLFFLIPFGVITYVASRDLWTLPCCVVLPVLLFGLAVWHLFSTRRDELRIYENGFTYKSGKTLHSCLWTEIETLQPRELNNREITELAGALCPLGAVEKKNGARIDFDADVPGTPEIIARFENRKLKNNAKS
jgi:hypothetical protein